MGGALASEDKIYTALAIRDTSGHDSSVDESKGFIPKTLIIRNGLNQSVSIQLQGDAEIGFSNPMDVGSPVVVAANTDSYETLTDYLPFLRATSTCSVAPTTGSLTVFVAKVGE